MSSRSALPHSHQHSSRRRLARDLPPHRAWKWIDGAPYLTEGGIYAQTQTSRIIFDKPPIQFNIVMHTACGERGILVGPARQRDENEWTACGLAENGGQGVGESTRGTPPGELSCGDADGKDGRGEECIGEREGRAGQESGEEGVISSRDGKAGGGCSRRARTGATAGSEVGEDRRARQGRERGRRCVRRAKRYEQREAGTATDWTNALRATRAAGTGDSSVADWGKSGTGVKWVLARFDDGEEKDSKEEKGKGG
ncbi:hypothetical protein B0H16DRAFT_1459112 [Mycena metata]|uniref:Uncharacterized protein n=1 Tax=Mycena metata TaxID=1033252 RepID=A0AAD7J310_9AGAR|nr:hypothetical protein B0H16DRAFT_1459112 [Mycena metata]